MTGSKTWNGIDAINETQVLGFFKKSDFGLELYKSFTQSIKSNMQTKMSKYNTGKILFGTNSDTEINIISIIIKAFNRLCITLFNFNIPPTL